MLSLSMRAPQPLDLQSALSEWLDQSHACGFSSGEVQEDLERLAMLRRTICTAGNDLKRGLHVLGTYMEYHAALLECEDRGFPSQDTDVSRRSLRFCWSGISPVASPETYYNIQWERANVLWNVAALQAYQASLQGRNSKEQLKKAVQLLQNAVSTLHYLKDMGLDYGADFASLAFWEKYYLAEAQISTYFLAQAARKPQPPLLAKLAVAAVPVLKEAMHLADQLPHSTDTFRYCKAWCAYMEGAAEYHEAISHYDKSQFGMASARLERARQPLALGQEIVFDAPASRSLDSLKQLLPAMMQSIRDAKYGVDQRNAYSRQEVPERLRDISGELVPSLDNAPVPELTAPQHLFSTLLGSEARQVIATFSQETERLLYDLTVTAEEQTEAGRKALAEVNLPHSLTAYKQEQSGGGIPMELWERVHSIQTQQRIPQLKRELWELRSAAEEAQEMYNEITKQLESDLEMDRLFREQYPDFSGHNVTEVQRGFAESLTNYKQLLTRSRDGDSAILRRLDMFDTDPKFRLLQFQKPQLDRLLPAGQNYTNTIDTSRLSRRLVDLSTLFRNREILLESLKDQIQEYNIRSRVATVDPDRMDADAQYEHVLQTAREHVDGLTREVRRNLRTQSGLVDDILAENDRFMAAREATSGVARASESCITSLEEALEEVDQLTEHLKEGFEFYKVVMPKLKKLRTEVNDVSARLAVERFEFEDHQSSSLSSRRDQEIQDERMAESLADGGGRAGGGAVGAQEIHYDPSRSQWLVKDGSAGSRDGRTTPRDRLSSSSQPGAESVPNDEPRVVVDDEKVAYLIGMDFDPEKVVAALRRYDNNLEQALNDLLMG